MNTRQRLHSADPFNTFDWIMDASEGRGLQGAFYFIVGHNDPHDVNYRIDHPAIRDRCEKYINVVWTLAFTPATLPMINQNLSLKKPTTSVKSAH